MADSYSLAFEPCDRPPCRAGCEPFEIVPQQRLCIEHLKHLVCVVAPVGGAVEHAAWPQATSGKCDEFGLDESALVLTLFRPRVRKVDADSAQGIVRDVLAQEGDRIAFGHSYIL